MVKNLPANAGDAGDLCLILGWGRQIPLYWLGYSSHGGRQGGRGGESAGWGRGVGGGDADSSGEKSLHRGVTISHWN